MPQRPFRNANVHEKNVVSVQALDRNARIGAGVTIQPFPSGTNIDTADWMVRDGIVVVPHHALIPAGSRISP